MELTLAENIRFNRKQRKMTQEQLADALGVTVGAVYKWESGQSVPELNLIVGMADFFDLSVDALLGYRMKDNRLDSVEERLLECGRRLDPESLAEAEKALGRYPHSFRIVFVCADLYLSLGGSNRNPKLLRRALELLERARVLLPQNDNARINDATICGLMATAYFHIGEQEKALELLKRSNAGGLFSDEIGSMLAGYMNRPEEAVPYLSDAVAKGMTCFLNAAFGYVFVYRSREDWDSAMAITTLVNSLVAGLRMEGEPGFMDKIHAEVLLLLAYARGKAGMEEGSMEALRRAAELAARFDSTPEYSLRTMRFLGDAENTTAFDTLGMTASASIEYILDLLGEREMSARWKEMISHEG